MLKAAEWRPDLPPLETGFTQFVQNVVPLDASYGAFAGLEPIGDALTARCQGAATGVGPDGTRVHFACDDDFVFQFSSSDQSWTAVNQEDMGTDIEYDTAATDMWDIAQYSATMIFVNGSYAPQKWTIGSSTALEDLGGSPPVARFAETFKLHVVLGRLASNNNKIHWSAIDDPEGWTAGTDLSGTQTFPDGGKIMGLVGRDVLTVLLETRIEQGTYVGSGDIIQFRPISLERGCAAEGSVAAFQGGVFFLAYDGFYLIEGESITPISAQKVTNYFWDNVNQDFLYRIVSVVSPRKTLYMVAFPSLQSGDGTPDTIMLYNWTTGWWSRASVSLDFLYRANTNVGLNLEELDAVFGNLDSIPISLDDPSLGGTSLETTAAFGTDFKLAFFNGANLEATVDSIEGELSPGQKTKVRAVRPLVDGGTPIVQLGGRNKIQDATSFGPQSVMRESGWCRTPSQSLWRYHRGRIVVPAGTEFTHIQGIDVLTTRGPQL